MKIKKITARQIIDSRGIPTIEVSAFSSKSSAKFSVPSGASVGSFEAYELRDGNDASFFGKSVNKAVNHVNTIINKALSDKNAFYQKEIDETLIDIDNTDNKSNLGANAILGASIAVAKLVAQEENLPVFKYIRALYDPYVSFELSSRYRLPLPMFNMLNGGAHAQNDVSVQEFMVIPVKAHLMHNRIKIASEINHALNQILISKGQNTAVGDEGGYAAIKSNPQMMTDTHSLLQLLTQASKHAGYKPGEDVFFGLDVASSKYYKEDSSKGGTYSIPNWTQLGDFTGNFEYLLDTYKDFCHEFALLSIEDGAAENDWPSWVKLKKSLGGDLYIVGDDLTVTSPRRLQKAVLLNCINAIIIKPNQIGTLTEVFQTASHAHENKIDIIVSHRSGETTDDFIADLSVGLNAKFYKGGNIMRGERVVKYNRLIEIEDMIK